MTYLTRPARAGAGAGAGRTAGQSPCRAPGQTNDKRRACDVCLFADARQYHQGLQFAADLEIYAMDLRVCPQIPDV